MDNELGNTALKQTSNKQTPNVATNVPCFKKRTHAFSQGLIGTQPWARTRVCNLWRAKVRQILKCNCIFLHVSVIRLSFSHLIARPSSLGLFRPAAPKILDVIPLVFSTGPSTILARLLFLSYAVSSTQSSFVLDTLIDVPLSLTDAKVHSYKGAGNVNVYLLQAPETQ
jgi:hypothetical protein